MGKVVHAVAALLCLTCSTWVTAQDKPAIIPLDQIHPGMHGTALTVFQGTKPEAMDVEVLGILHKAGVPLRPRGVLAQTIASTILNASGFAWVISVATKPGATALTRMPADAHSQAIDFVIEAIPALAAP